MKIILDPGSAHDGDIGKARALVRIASKCGADAIKFQLLTKAQECNGNIGMDWNWLPELMEVGAENGIEVFASVFDQAGEDFLVGVGSKSVKYAYSQRAIALNAMKGRRFENSYVSLDVMDDARAMSGWTKLYVIPEYPVRYVVDFEGIFPRFDGFSSHCLGMEQEIRAVEAGAKVLEFHFKGDWESPTPDGRFAKSPRLTENLISRIRNMTSPAKYDGRDFS